MELNFWLLRFILLQWHKHNLSQYFTPLTQTQPKDVFVGAAAYIFIKLILKFKIIFYFKLKQRGTRFLLKNVSSQVIQISLLLSGQPALVWLEQDTPPNQGWRKCLYGRVPSLSSLSLSRTSILLCRCRADVESHKTTKARRSALGNGTESPPHKPFRWKHTTSHKMPWKAGFESSHCISVSHDARYSGSVLGQLDK